MGVEVIGPMLAHHRGEIAMDRVFVRTVRFELDRDVGNPKIGGDTTANILEQFVRESAAVLVNEDMTGQHHQARFNGPNVQIVNIVHPWDCFDGR